MYLRSAFVHMEVFMEGMCFPFCTRAEGNAHRFRRRTGKICPVTENKLPHYRNSCSAIEKGNGNRTAIRRRTASYGSPFCLSRYFLMHSSFDSPLATPLRHVRASLCLLAFFSTSFGPALSQRANPFNSPLSPTRFSSVYFIFVRKLSTLRTIICATLNSP